MHTEQLSLTLQFPSELGIECVFKGKSPRRCERQQPEHNTAQRASEQSRLCGWCGCVGLWCLWCWSVGLGRVGLVGFGGDTRERRGGAMHTEQLSLTLQFPSELGIECVYKGNSPRR
jgi:hypothetical protein